MKPETVHCSKGWEGMIYREWNFLPAGSELRMLVVTGER